MGLYTKESLDQLRTKVDLVDLLSSYMQLKRAGATYKGLCPFHEEKSPSFIVQRGDSHYHCFGCGAHGDAIAFLMGHSKMSFTEAVEVLAEKFGVLLQKTEGEERGSSKLALKNALELACRFYHTLLLHTEEGHQALRYLYDRGIDLDFIQYFRLGYAPSQRDALLSLAKGENISEELLRDAGLLSEKRGDFFSDRITIPITDAFGAVIGFSARKYKEETFGGKYINSPETSLFKKSHTLFGLSYSRPRIAKERKAIIVEGQIDCLRLIHSGFNFVVAAQGTAFGEAHAKILIDLGVRQIYLAMDGDNAGRQASIKVGHLFQKKGIEVRVVPLPSQMDPDSFLRKMGKEAFEKLLTQTSDYLSFLVKEESLTLDLSVPAQKSELIRKLSDQIRTWEEPVMVHESLRKLAQLTSVPESMLGAGTLQHTHVKQFGFVQREPVNADRILETDLLAWVLRRDDPKLWQLVKGNLSADHFYVPVCKHIFTLWQTAKERGEACDYIALGHMLNSEEEKLVEEIVKKRINLNKAEEGLKNTLQQFLTRKWQDELQNMHKLAQKPQMQEEERMVLFKEIAKLHSNPPKLKT